MDLTKIQKTTKNLEGLQLEVSNDTTFSLYCNSYHQSQGGLTCKGQLDFHIYVHVHVLINYK